MRVNASTHSLTTGMPQIAKARQRVNASTRPFRVPDSPCARVAKIDVHLPEPIAPVHRRRPALRRHIRPSDLQADEGVAPLERLCAVRQGSKNPKKVLIVYFFDSVQVPSTYLVESM